MEQRNFYKILEVDNKATEDEIKHAYRRLAVLVHPDRNPDDPACEEKFKELIQAYEVIRDPVRRAQYDRERLEAAGRGGKRGGGEGVYEAGLGDFFEEILTRAGERVKTRRGADLRYHLEIDLEEAALGGKKTIRVPRRRTCPDCSGSGARPGSRPKKCPHCGGSGRITLQGSFFSISKKCEQCGGPGWVITERCPRCFGGGAVDVQEEVEITIPAGVDNGTRLKQRRRGMPGMDGGDPGDLYVVVSIEDHPVFSRVEDDLHCEARISFPQAALGADLEVPTLYGPVKIEIPAGTQSGRIFQVHGMGMPSLPDGERGELFVKLIVETPTDLTQEQQELIEQFAKAIEEGSATVSKRFKKKVREVFQA